MNKKQLTLYQKSRCPYCIKTMKLIKSLKLKVDRKDIDKSEKHSKILLKEGGKMQVPCLKISDNNTKTIWLYESSAIIDYLKNL